MINFPVAGGTSGHLLGGTLAAITLGPWAGMLVMTAVIAVQALLLQDGGLLVMGANILNMGLITVAMGYGLYRGVSSGNRTLKLTVAGVAAWLTVMAGALFTSLQLWLSGTSQLQIVIPAMLSVHALIGIGEALITVAALTFILQTRPDLLGQHSASTKGSRAGLWQGADLACVVLLRHLPQQTRWA
jgi:cobalt/nickel transport system permease protein